MQTSKRRADTPEYRKAYNRGWRSTGNLDTADARREPAAWYDGYHDLASGRAKWHSLHCDEEYGHDNCPDTRPIPSTAWFKR
jgi:hypothetical protein